MPRSFGSWLMRRNFASDDAADHIQAVFADELRLHGWLASEFPTPRSAAAMYTGAIDMYLGTFARLAHAWGGVAGLDKPDPLPLPGRHHSTDPDQSPVTAEEHAWAVDAISKARVIAPKINPNGLNGRRHGGPREAFSDVELREIVLCRRWLSLVRPSGHYYKEDCSYRLKHVVEDWYGEYISNGCLLVAALAMGIKHRAEPDKPDALNAVVGLNASDVQSLLWRMNYRQRHRDSCCLSAPYKNQLDIDHDHEEFDCY